MLASYALGFWFGSRCVMGSDECRIITTEDTSYKTGDVLVVFFSLLMAGFNLNQIGPSLEKITVGRQAAARIYAVLDRDPQIKSPDIAIIPKKINGLIKFENVSFSYPKEPGKKILTNFSAEFDINHSAIVG